ncbi:DUF4157 domain-containing protein [Azoarcus sp. L1K30]|uniref:eCIS core domain-containing protein n=1 Tax=Azoarcus sp. L1K30 TaxID=2820277 RepID=UPI001B825E28|nr:DUF4157 domain-containing protein [Azoarcus sp. L1K30]MBR0565471.1 DUF4157 domain-containing protein [Azoarcus sp. L1K30]
MSATTHAPSIAAREPLARPPVRTLQRKCACQKNRTRDDERRPGGLVQRRTQRAATCQVVPEEVGAVLHRAGQPLPDAIREDFESRFGHDFSHVRIHTDAQAAQSAAAVSARAYTVGRDIVFNRGEFQPGSHQGRHLLAHELTHVIQQAQMSGGGAFEIGAEHSAFELEADRVADRIVAGTPPTAMRPPASASAWREAPLAIRPAPAAMIQRVGECAGKGGYNCNGVRCTTAAGRRGMCQWGGLKYGCNCRDQSNDEDAVRRVREALPYWLFAILSAAAIAAIAACFASGACEVATIIGAVGAGAAAIVIAALEAAGVTVSDGSEA